MTPFEVRDARFHDAVPAGGRIERIVDGLGFGEGPIWHPREHWLFFSDIAKSEQWLWSENEGQRLARKPSNQANGNFFDAQGCIVSCEHATSQVVRHEHDGKLVRPIATHWQGRELNSPNDICRHPDGSLWFTDPHFGRVREPLGLLREQELGHQGVYRIDANGSLALMIDDFDQPNGLCFSRDWATLYVNDSPRGHIRAFDTDGRTVANARHHADITWGGAGVEGSEAWVPDGLKTDEKDRLWCNGPGGVHLLAPGGETLGVVHFPEKSTNFCFGGADLSVLFVTTANCVYRLQTQTHGVAML